MISSESITFVLRTGENLIYINEEEKKVLGKYCGLFPLGKAALVTTHGLKYNLNKQMLKFDSIVSSSNEFDFSDAKSLLVSEDNTYKRRQLQVCIETDEDVLFTMSIN